MEPAPLINNFFDLNDLNNLYCKEEDHTNNEIIGLCIDDNCNINNKLICYKCIFRNHNQHKLLELTEIKEKLKKELEIFKENQNYKNLFENDFNKIETEIRTKFNKIKESFIKNFDENVKDYINNVKNEFKNIFDKNDNNSNINFIDLKNQIIHNNNENISKIFTNFLNKKNYNNNNLLVNKNNLYEKINKIQDNFINSEIKLYETNIKKDFKKSLYNMNNENYKKIDFEWDNKTYGVYNFLYDISKKNIATKTKENGTITVIKSKNILEKTKNYSVKVLINNYYGGDFQIGFGSDRNASCCWLKNGPTYYITDEGIFSGGRLLKQNGFKYNDIINFKIYLTDEPNYYEIFINNNAIYQDNFDIKNEKIYILAAIRNCINSIEITEFNEIL